MLSKIREIIKKIFKNSGIRRINSFARFMRSFFYSLADFFGDVIFFLLKIFRIIAEHKKLSAEEIGKILIMNI